MSTERMAPSLFAIGIGVRAALFSALAFAVIELASTGRFYATALVVTGIGVLVLLDLARYVNKGDRMLERFVEALAAGDLERPARTAGTMTGFRRLTLAIERAVTQLDESRAQRQRQIDYLQTLIDNVSVAVLVVDERGSVTLANRAARKLAERPVHTLDQLRLLGPSVARELVELTPGDRKVVRLINGQRVLASLAHFSAGGARLRVLSLQNIESELDAVELKAWQDVLRVLAHEMMNSLTPISSLSESVLPLVKELQCANVSADSGRRLESVEQIHDIDLPAARSVEQTHGSVQQIAADIGDALDAIARRSAGLVSFVERYRKMAELPPPALGSVRAAELIRRIEQLMSSTFADKGIDYAIRIESPELTVRADRELLEQALINLLHNAIEACADTDQPRVQVECRLQDGDVAISVADNGRGLGGVNIDRMFVPFFTTKAGGSGIGLSLARQIAHAHRGKLEVTPNSPRGAVFTLSIPVPAEGRSDQM